MSPAELLASMLTELADGKATVRPDTRIGYLSEIGLDAFDLVLAAVAIEVHLRVEIPDSHLERRDWTVERFAEEAIKLPRLDDPLFPFRKLRMLCSAVERSVRDHMDGSAGEEAP